jgi:hypothetical protein
MINQFEIIQDLIKKCRRDEIKSLKAFLAIFYATDSKKNDKSLRLLGYLTSKINLTEEAICKKLYGNVNASSKQSFRRLQNRFKSKLYECLCLDVNVYRRDSLSELSQYRLEMRKLIMYFFVLRGRLINQEFVRLIDRGIHIGKKYELYYDLVNLLFSKMEIMSFNSSYDKLQKLEQEVKYYQEAHDAFREASNFHQKLVLSPGAKARGYGKLEDFPIIIERLKQSAKKYGSSNIEYLQLIISMEYAHKIYDYKMAEEISFRQLQLYQESPAVYLKARVAGSYLNLGNNQMYLYKFKEAHENIVASYPVYSAYSLNFYIAKEIEFYVHYYSGNLTRALDLINEIIIKGQKHSSSFQTSKRSFLLASVLLLNKCNREAHKVLQDTKEIEKDKEGWNLGIRILSIINQLETEKLDLVDLNIESLRKHIERTIKMKAVRKRDVIILKLLAKLSRQGFNFRQVWKKNQKYFELLASNDPEYRWEMKSPEMVIFHRWFEAKVYGKEYDYVLRAPEEESKVVS